MRKQERGRDEEADRRRAGGREQKQQQQCVVRSCSRLERRLLFAGKGERAAELPSDRARRRRQHAATGAPGFSSSQAFGGSPMRRS